MAGATKEFSTVTASVDPPHPTSVTPTLAASTTAVTLLDSSKENPSVRRDKPDSEPRVTKGMVPLIQKFPSMKWGH